jgi:ribosomal protein L7/L12
MNDKNHPLPEHVLDALHQHNKTEAIKRLCESRALSLQEAQHMIDAYMDAGASGSSGASFGRLPNVVLAAIQRGQKAEAVRLLRSQTHLSFEEAKEAVEAGSLSVSSTSSEVDAGEIKAPSGFLFWLIGIGCASYILFYFAQHLE